ncbi:NAD(P)/FAD-dependent oxidoreductase [Streptomyces sp. NPDC052040]|uniref:NAD(P)/FAD-dependent oxidoreductase n=1 Tax=unclassified Streptomyces TaxID=2593676 RepID=UPI0037D867AA
MSRTAIVVGASVAGLLAAAALADVVDEVTLIERDALPDEAAPRRGLPQGRHAHILLTSGLDAIEALLPGLKLRQRVLAAGGREISMTSGAVMLGPEGWFRRWRHDSHPLLTCSRDLLDSILREAVLGRPGIRLRRGRAVSLLGSAGRITGVRVADGEAEGAEEDLSADLVVDAGGRGSRAVQWLGSLGVAGIREEVVDSGVVYASRVYRMPAGAESFPLVLVQPDPMEPAPGRAAALVPIEGGRWLASLSGTRGGEPTDDPAEFARFALGLRHPLVGRLISGAEPLSAVSLSRSTRNVRRRFETAETWPDGFVVLGDAAAAFNPVYGQGMSVAALGAQALRRELEGRDAAAPGTARRIQHAAAGAVNAAWALSSSQDRWFPDVLGDRPSLADRVLTRYVRRMTRVATSSYRVSAAMCNVTTLQEDGRRLLRPSLLLATLGGPVLPPLAGPPLTAAEQTVLRGLDRTAGGARDAGDAGGAGDAGDADAAGGPGGVQEPGTATDGRDERSES